MFTLATVENSLHQQRSVTLTPNASRARRNYKTGADATGRQLRHSSGGSSSGPAGRSDSAVGLTGPDHCSLTVGPRRADRSPPCRQQSAVLGRPTTITVRITRYGTPINGADSRSTPKTTIRSHIGIMPGRRCHRTDGDSHGIMPGRGCHRTDGDSHEIMPGRGCHRTDGDSHEIMSGRRCHRTDRDSRRRADQSHCNCRETKAMTCAYVLF